MQKDTSGHRTVPVWISVNIELATYEWMDDIVVTNDSASIVISSVIADVGLLVAYIHRIRVKNFLLDYK